MNKPNERMSLEEFLSQLPENLADIPLIDLNDPLANQRGLTVPRMIDGDMIELIPLPEPWRGN